MTLRLMGTAQFAGAALVAVIAAAVAVWGFAALSAPADYQARRLALESQLRTAERLSVRPGDSTAYPPGAVCEGIAGEGLERVRRTMEGAATAEGMVGVQVQLGAPVDISGKIAPVPLRIEAEGSYDRVASLMDRLGRGAPQVFVETSDLRSRGDSVRLSLSGRVFCWTGG
jgi:hypothetical protein